MTATCTSWWSQHRTPTASCAASWCQPPAARVLFHQLLLLLQHQRRCLLSLRLPASRRKCLPLSRRSSQLLHKVLFLSLWQLLRPLLQRAPPLCLLPLPSCLPHLCPVQPLLQVLLPSLLLHLSRYPDPVLHHRRERPQHKMHSR